MMVLGETDNEVTVLHYPSHELHRLEESRVQDLYDEVDDHEFRQMKDKNHYAIKEISTAFNGGKAQFGAMFDIRSLPNNIVRIDSIAFHTLDVVQRCNIQIFTKRGSYEFFEEESSAWKRIKSVTTECRGPGRKTVVSLSEGNYTDYEDMRINRSERRAFYIRSIETQIIYSVADKQNTVYKEDGHVQIFTGVAVGQYFKDFWTPRMLNIAVTYVVERLWSGQVTLGGSKPGLAGQPIGDDVCTSTLDVMTKDGVNKNYGIMFNIKSNSERDLTIYGLGFYVDTSSMIEYEIYSLKGGFEHGSATLSLWTKVAEGTEKDANRGNLIMVAERDFAAVKIKGGETYGFYLTLHTENLQYHSTSVTLSSTYLQNKDLIVSVGAGVSDYPFDFDTNFLARRALKGAILYGIDKECRPEVSVKYSFIVKYPKHMSTEEVYGEINTTVEKIIKFFLRSDNSLKALKDSFDLDLYSVFSQHDSNPPAICTEISDSLSCDSTVTDMVFSYKEEGLDEGHLSYKILQHVNTVVSNLNSDALDVEYTGEETLDTNMLITLAGVPNEIMSTDEVGYFQGITRGFLKQKEEGTLKVLSVQVQEQSLQDRRFLLESHDNINGKFVIREGQESGVIDITTKVSGKHQPPSPGLDFEQLVEDSINAEDGSFREALMKGNEDNPNSESYFETVREVYAKPVSIFPTKAPLVYEEPRSNGMSGPISIAIIVCASLLTFGLVFGAFVYRKRQQDKKRFRKSIFDDDEDDPLFFDMFEGKRPNNNTTIIPPFARAKSKRAQSVVSAETGALTEDTSAMMSRQMSSFRGAPSHESARFAGERPTMIGKDRPSRRASIDFISGSRPMSDHLLDNPAPPRTTLRRHSLSNTHGHNEYSHERNQGTRIYQSQPVIGHIDHGYEDRIQQKFREGAPRNFEGRNSDRVIRSNPRVAEVEPDYEDRILRKFQENRPSYPEANYTRRSTDRLQEEAMGRRSVHGLDIDRQQSRNTTHSSEHNERIRKKFEGFADGDDMRRSGDLSGDPSGNPSSNAEMERQRSRQSAYSSEHEERIQKKFQGLQDENMKMRQSSEPEIERQRSRQSAHSMSDHEERIRKKFQGLDDDGIRRPTEMTRNDMERQRSRQSALSSEHEERIRMKQQGINEYNRPEDDKGVDLSKSYGKDDQKLPGDDIEGNREWDRRKKIEEPEEPRIEMPAHMRFERRPSEDGVGVDFMSESTASTLSTHFTRIKNKEAS